MGACNVFQSKGLPIYPVRYAVAPSNMPNSLPYWIKKDNLPTLSKYSKYTLRTVRAGYLYLLSQYNNEENLAISVYCVDEEGGFWQQDLSHDFAAMDYGKHLLTSQVYCPLAPIPSQCGSKNHQPDNIQFITLPRAEECDTAWLALPCL